MVNHASPDFDAIIERRGSCSIKWNSGDSDLLPMWVADMDFLAPETVIEALAKRAQQGCFGYPDNEDITVKEAVSFWLETRHQTKTSPTNIFPITSCCVGLFHCVHTLTQEGDSVIIQTPVYPPFYQVIKDQGRTILENPLIYKDGLYQIDFDDLEAKAKKAKMLLFCSPHNPSGRVWSQDELKRVAEICLRNNVIVVADEIHNDLTYQKHTVLFSLSPEISQNTIMLMSPSKTFNLAGLSTGFLCTENKNWYNTLHQGLEKQHQSINIFGLTAAKTAYRTGGAWLDKLLPYLLDNAQLINTFLAEELPFIKMNVPQGTYLAWLDFRQANLQGLELDAFLRKKAKLWLTDGQLFGSAGKGFSRMNFACPRSRLETALNQLKASFQ